jgi:hypothetical protein
MTSFSDAFLLAAKVNGLIRNSTSSSPVRMWLSSFEMSRGLHERAFSNWARRSSSKFSFNAFATDSSLPQDQLRNAVVLHCAAAARRNQAYVLLFGRQMTRRFRSGRAKLGPLEAAFSPGEAARMDSAIPSATAALPGSLVGGISDTRRILADPARARRHTGPGGGEIDRRSIPNSSSEHRNASPGLGPTMPIAPKSSPVFIPPSNGCA